MNIKKLIGAAAAVSIAAVSLFAVSASATETKEITLKYVDSSSAEIGSVTYDKDTSLSYSLDSDSSNALANAKAGDTVTITYKVSADGNDTNRAGFNIAGTQFYVNSSGTTGINPNFLTSKACHLNTKLDKDKPATITYEFKLGDNGQPTQITEAKIADAYGNTKSYTDASKTKLPQSLSSNASLGSLTFNTTTRTDTESNTITLSNFQAVLTTTADTSAAVSDVTAVPTTDGGSDYVFSGDDGWYAKAFKFSVTPGTNTVKGISVKIGEKSESKTVSLTSDGNTSYAYGIIVGANSTDALEGITPTVMIEE